jgi:hypothetical protein
MFSYPAYPDDQGEGTAGGPAKQPAAPMIHLTLQGKGGVGKSLVASILFQYFRHHGKELHCIDSDPVNQTFSQYAELGAEHLALMRDGRIDTSGFDHLLDRFLDEDGIFVVDNGPSTFVPLWGYIVENNVLETLAAAGRKLCVHTIVTGGQALWDTLKRFTRRNLNVQPTIKVPAGYKFVVRVNRDILFEAPYEAVSAWSR